jgi:hypothetical protein
VAEACAALTGDVADDAWKVGDPKSTCASSCALDGEAVVTSVEYFYWLRLFKVSCHPGVQVPSKAAGRCEFSS